MTAGKYLLEIEQGATFRQQINWVSGGLPVDLTGASAVMQVRSEYEADTATVELNSEVNGGIELDDEGNVSLYLSAVDTSDIAAGKYVYDIELTLANGDVKRLLSGNLIVSREVTR